MRPAPAGGVSALRAYALALRPKTLSAGLVPVSLGALLPVGWQLPHPARAAVAVAVALLLQMGTNLYNDYADFVAGADTAERLGPRRATQQGWLRPAQVHRAALAVFGGAACLGLYLVACGGWPIFWLGLGSLLAGLAYTGGPAPLAYHGLGELFVWIFFGPVAVVGSAYLQRPTPLPAPLWWMGASLGCLAAALLVVNNLRDIHSDARVGKRTLATRLGDRATRRLYALLLLAAYAAAAAAARRQPGLWLVLASLPGAAWLIARLRQRRGAELNRQLAQTAQLELGFGLLAMLGAGF